MNHTATYSPEDNKLRIYPACRLSAEEYAKLKAVGYKWAPKQELFVAPMWTPAREDAAIALAGEIEDEDKSLVERQEERAERFEGYQANRAKDAEQARQAVKSIADNIPLGQPILVGHHSERHARRDAEKIENGMRRAVKMWNTSKYWEDRAAGAIAHAKYKELPAVRARRIKTIEADLRKQQRNRADIDKRAARWAAITTHEEAYAAACRSSGTVLYKDGQSWSAYDLLRPAEERYAACPVMTFEEVKAKIAETAAAYRPICDRWIAHFENRLRYERAMLAASGWTPPKKAPTKAALPLLNYNGTIRVRNPWHRGQVDEFGAVPMTKADYAKINSDYKGTRVSEDGTHRVRWAMCRGHNYGPVFLTDSTAHVPPGAEAAAAKLREEEAARMAKAIERAERPRPEPPAKDQAAEDFDAMAQTLKAGIKTVSAPQLFPTPHALAERMADIAGIGAGMQVLEPSAGTGRLIDAVRNLTANEPTVKITAVEVDRRLAGMLTRADAVYTADFLDWPREDTEGTAPVEFDRIVMNPPFRNAEDLQHIQHAITLLKPGGRLVALCAAGPRQTAKLVPMATKFEQLPPGTFAAEGTGVNVALVVIDKPGRSTPGLF